MLRDTKTFSLLCLTITIIAAITSVMLLFYRGPLIWIPFVIGLAAFLLHTGGAFLIWSGLPNFKDKFRNAYKYICIAIIFVGFTQLQLPIISIFDWWQLLENGVVIIPFVIPFIFFPIGIRRFATLLRIKSRWTSAWLINGVGLLVGLLLAILPHAPNNTNPLNFAFTLVLLGWIAIHTIALIVMVHRIKKVIGVRYINAMAWLYVTYVSVLATNLMYIATLLLLSPGNWYVDYNLSIAPFVIVGLLWLRAGYAFNLIASTGPIPNHLGDFFGPMEQKTSNIPSADIIIYVAELASNAREIDPILDGLREVTSKVPPGGTVRIEDQSTLAQVYLKLESYLVNQDPLRKFTQTELRELINRTFAQQTLTQTFWPILQEKAVQV
jgi:hypothetical protein